jgi:hypothetical protein
LEEFIRKDDGSIALKSNLHDGEFVLSQSLRQSIEEWAGSLDDPATLDSLGEAFLDYILALEEKLVSEDEAELVRFYFHNCYAGEGWQIDRTLMF